MEACPFRTPILQVSVEACSRPHVQRSRDTDGPGWIPLEPDKWKSPAGDRWEFSGGAFTNILDEIHTRTVNMEWTKASTHLDGNGLEQGVDMCGFHKQHAWLVRNDLHGKAGLMKDLAAGAGGCLLLGASSGSQNLDSCGKRRNLRWIPGQCDVGA